MHCQKEFDEYYKAIKLNEEKADLREKRCMLIDELKAGLPDTRCLKYQLGYVKIANFFN